MRHKIYLGLGSNLGDTNKNIAAAVDLLSKEFDSLTVSPVFKTPPHLPNKAPKSWNKPYLNCAVECYSNKNLEDTWRLIQKIELESGRLVREKWSPRIIDIDFLLYDREVVNSKDLNLVLPHPLMDQRSFVLRPLSWLSPDCRIPGSTNSNSMLKVNRDLREKLPIWMVILNVTPDSFSDGGLYPSQEMLYLRIKELINQGAHIIDIGAESTRPGATVLSDKDEWNRLAPIFEIISTLKEEFLLMPKISLDTYHSATAKRAIIAGIDIINDVSGLTDPNMINLIPDSSCKWILMHSLSIPADKNITINDDINVTDYLYGWFSNRISELEQYGVKNSKLILDLGIGFGKTAKQSLLLIENIDRFMDLECLLMVGHSRKSFMAETCGADMSLRDLETVNISKKLIDKGVDIVRIHNLELHQNIFLNY